MRSQAGSPTLSVDLVADLAGFEASLRRADGVLGQSVSRMEAKARQLDATLARTGKSFDFGLSAAPLDRFADDLTDVQRRIDGMFQQSGASARASASAFQEIEQAGRSVDLLEMELDPTVAALRRFEAAQRSVASAVEAGA
ncbi:MAG: hypothetical protein AAFU61_18570, partial [Pseudomonadota bacterium]